MFTLGLQLPYGTLEANIQSLLEVDLITMLAVDHEHHKLMRMHTNRPGEYATGDTWPLWPSRWQQQVFDRGEWLYCANPDQVLQAFRDGSDILALGYQAAVAFPISTPSAMERPVVGAVNLLFKQRLDGAVAVPVTWCRDVLAQIDRFASNLTLTTPYMDSPTRARN